jgi:hypothetical protein
LGEFIETLIDSIPQGHPAVGYSGANSRGGRGGYAFGATNEGGSPGGRSGSAQP